MARVSKQNSAATSRSANESLDRTRDAVDRSLDKYRSLSARRKKKKPRHTQNHLLQISAILCPAIAFLAMWGLAKIWEVPNGGQYEGRSVLQWSKMLGNDDPASRTKAINMLVSLKHEAVPQVRAQLKSPKTETRRDAVTVLQRVRPEDQKTAKALGDSMYDPDVWVRWRAGQTLRNMGPQAKSAVFSLSDALKDEDPSVRYVAAEALGAIGEKAIMAHPALLKASKDQRTFVRRAAKTALEKIVPKTEKEKMQLKMERFYK